MLNRYPPLCSNHPLHSEPCPICNKSNLEIAEEMAKKLLHVDLEQRTDAIYYRIFLGKYTLHNYYSTKEDAKREINIILLNIIPIILEAINNSKVIERRTISRSEIGQW
jgi:hypothetical protein